MAPGPELICSYRNAEVVEVDGLCGPVEVLKALTMKKATNKTRARLPKPMNRSGSPPAALTVPCGALPGRLPA